MNPRKSPMSGRSKPTPQRGNSNIHVRNTAWMLLGQAAKLVLQAAYFIIIARSLGVNQYGAFIAVVAFTQILAPFVGLGSPILLMKNVARDRELFSEYWGNLLFLTSASGIIAIGLVIGVSQLVLPKSIPIMVVVLVSIAELVFSKIIEGAAFAFGAIERMSVTAQLNIATSLSRLIGILGLVMILPHPTAFHWAWVYMLTTVICAALGFVLVHMQIGHPRLGLKRVPGELREGLYYSASTSAQTIYNDIDKTMLARIGSLDAAGIYAAAYRLIDVAYAPVRALQSAAYPGFFRIGQGGLASTVVYLKQLLKKSAAYGALTLILLLVCAPVIPHVLGGEYTRTVEALRWLALLPLLKSVHSFLADALTGTGHQGLRTLIQFGVAAFNVIVNLWIIPIYSWRGAAWSSIASDGLLMITLLLALVSVSRNQNKPTTFAIAEI